MSVLSKNIRKLRKEKGLTQNALAELLSVGGSNIYHYENNSSTPSVENLIILADFFNISLDDLLRNPDVSIGSKLYPIENGEAPNVQESSPHEIEDRSLQDQELSIIKTFDSIFVMNLAFKEHYIQTISEITGKSTLEIEQELKRFQDKIGK